MKQALVLLALISSWKVFAEIIVLKNIVKNNDNTRTIVSSYPNQQLDEKFLQFNPFVPHHDTVMQDLITSKGKLLYSAVYHTGLYGFRKTATNEKASSHVLLAGDSNVFGVGVQDDETLATQLSTLLPDKKIINLGLGGTGPNSLLYFLQHYSLTPLLSPSQHGLMIFDFHHHLIERVIGSKNFLGWFEKSPRYVLEGDKLIYAGPFNQYWLGKFYLFLNQLPWNHFLFPNLPRISHSHLVLTSKVLAQIKTEYLRQTNPQNRFIVTFNPAYGAKSPTQQKQLKQLQKLLQQEKVEFVTFENEERKPLPLIPGENHLTPEAHQNYAHMLLKKLNLANQ